ncbi:hypothetical protein N2152v2_000212 [Parachlorella kessleri]
MAYYRPDPARRQVPLQPQQAALLFIDVQNYNCSKQGAIYRSLSPEQQQDASVQYFFDRVATILPNWQRLQQGCRTAGVEVMYTVIQSLTSDGRDRSLDYKISGFHVSPGSFDAQMLDSLLPAADEIVLPKTSSSVFQSTNLDYILRNLGVQQLILCGCVTDQCVEHAVRDACDLGYLVTLVPEACATYSQERHDSSLRAVAGYCRQRSIEEVLDELTSLAEGSMKTQM